MAVKLTPREKAVCQLLAEGYNNRKICEELGVKLSMVKKYCYLLCIKTGMSDRLELALWYIKHRSDYE